MLHIFNGDSAAGSFRQLFADADVVTARDALCEGPLPIDADRKRWLDVRASFLSDEYGTDETDTREQLAELEDALDRLGDADEVVLWFGRDLFCLVVMMRLLAELRGRNLRKLSMVCPDGPASTPPFYCLGEVPPMMLVSFLEQRRPVTAGDLDRAATAWSLYTADDPRALNAALDGSVDVGALPARAIELHAARFPDVDSGLGALEHAALLPLVDGPLRFGPLLAGYLEATPDYGATDLIGRSTLYRLIDRDPALVTADMPDSAGYLQATYAITEAGRQALDGQLDADAGSRGPRWLGGARVDGPSPWRWHPATRRIEEA